MCIIYEEIMGDSCIIWYISRREKLPMKVRYNNTMLETQGK